MGSPPRNHNELVERLNLIKAMGFVMTHRAHDTGIGKTLEDLLEIPENNFRLPDVGDIELKAKRLGSGAMLTVATRAAEPKGANKALFDRYKYRDEVGELSLHCTVVATSANPLGFRLVLEGDRILIDNPAKVPAYYPLSIFEDVIETKSRQVMLVFAESKGERKTFSEQFHYVEAYLASGINKAKFLNSLKSGAIKIDIRIGIYRSGTKKGQYHDHGTGIRLLRKSIVDLYDKVDRLI